MLLNMNKKIIVCAILFSTFMSVTGKDILVEGKGSLFVANNEIFKDIYHTCGDVGLEVTGNLFNNLYGFISSDLVVKSGQTATFDSPTKINIVNIGIGLKYFVPFSHGDFYVGLGIEPTYLCTLDSSLFVPVKHDQWSCGTLAKIGVVFDLPHSFFTDIFLNYSFTESDFNTVSQTALTQLNDVFLSGCLFGIGFGYRFN